MPASKKGNGSDNGQVSSKFIRECLSANELGDGMLYAEANRNHFLFNKSAGEWMAWAGHHWQQDIMNDAKAGVEDVAKIYLDEAKRIVDQIDAAIKKKEKERAQQLQETQDKIYKRVGRLRSERGRTNTLKFAHTNPSNAIAITGEELDTNPWLLACKNGVIDLQTGRLRPGRIDDYISKACPVEWKGLDHPAPAWEKAVTEIFDSNQSMVDYINRLLGYSITGLTYERIMPVFFGKLGFNGKGTIVETVKHVMGPLAAPIMSELLLDQGRVKNSAGPSPDIMSLKGLRIAFASETDQGRRFSQSKVKLLTGGDTLRGRNPHAIYETVFEPTHMVILLTNHQPQATGDDNAFWKRLHLIQFELSFVTHKPVHDHERPADLALKEKLITEGPGILAWLVRGCLEWQRIGLDPPPKIIKDTNQYRQEEDILEGFIKDCCYEDPKTLTPSADLFDKFKEWYSENVTKRGFVGRKQFGRMMGMRFDRVKKGTQHYVGIGLLID